MENIKKFEDFLDRMIGLLDNAKKQGHIFVRVEDLENTFPELAESKDEKIRKWLICGMNALKEQKTETFATIPIDDAIAWLEKQGEKKPFDYENANIQQKDLAPKATTANCQLYNRAILKILSNYVEKYPDIRFGQMLFNLGVKPHFNQESKETYWNLSKTINKQNHE